MTALILSLLLSQTSVQPIPCNLPVQKFMLFPFGDGGAQFCPSSQTTLADGGIQFGNGALNGRKAIILCNSRANGGAPILTVRWDWDGGWPSAAVGASQTPGWKGGVGDCVTLAIPSGTPARCIMDSVDAGVEITECR